jgi:hypothetical protein
LTVGVPPDPPPPLLASFFAFDPPPVLAEQARTRVIARDREVVCLFINSKWPEGGKRTQ